MTEGYFRLQCSHCGAWLKGAVGQTRFTCPKCRQPIKATAPPTSSPGQTPVELPTPNSSPPVGETNPSPPTAEAPAPATVMSPPTASGVAVKDLLWDKRLLIIAGGVGVIIAGVILWFVLSPGGKSVGRLAADLQHADPKVRREAARALGEMDGKAKAAVPALIDALNHSDDKLQYLALKALANIGPDRDEGQAAIPALARMLKDHDRNVRYYAVKTLSKLRPEGPEAKTAVPALTALLSDTDAGIRYYTAKALRAIGPEAGTAIPALKKAANDTELKVRNAVSQALKEIEKKKT